MVTVTHELYPRHSRHREYFSVTHIYTGLLIHPDLLHGLEPVKQRHLQIHEHVIELALSAPRMHVLHNFSHCFFPIECGADLNARLALPYQFLQNKQVVGRVIHYQNGSGIV